MTENDWRSRIVCDPELHHGEPCPVNRGLYEKFSNSPQSFSRIIYVDSPPSETPMNAIRIRKHLDSNTLHLPELRGMIGHDVEITVRDQTAFAKTPTPTLSWT